MNKILERAARVIEERGWAIGVYETTTGAVCASRAISIACIEGAGQRETIMIKADARSRLGELFGHESIASWNDSKGQTKENVIASLRKAAQ